ncbi:VPLPA-CTERM sorting domain-containing protein [Ruegeria sp. Ofav3-42]|uniref:VPLPA-CTERM sorting domain-containing protein n=1 Tax=Ruegeria sp. Ofav3-42 TaxID=2917759 RepID=UPI001EF6D3E4|nr:VPLPA-CTERM sorting domain-containing protein [Ruegeria sp. Ofav3-42]MCG7522765.1 VPLPA-CTERM sorting domain-containing protein [Ruegeria sp. Ofav3-42]
MRAIITAVALAFFSSAANAVTVSYDGHDWEVSVLVGTYESNDTLLQSQIWWGNSTIAETFASAVADWFGYPNTNFSPDIGPLFATSIGPTQSPTQNAVFGKYFGQFQNVSNFFTYDNFTQTYARAEKISAVPIPASLTFLFAGLVGLGLLARRRDHSDL